MAAKGKRDGTPAVVRIHRRKPRVGIRRGAHMTLLDDYVIWLEREAARGRTRVGEVVMDLVDQARRRTRGEPAAVDDAA